MTAMTYPTSSRLDARPPSRGLSPSVPVRLTRRGRVLLVLVLVTLLLAAAFTLGRSSASAGHAGPVVRRTTVVQPGETLWQIARRAAPGADPRATVARLTDLNDLRSGPIVAGQRLVLPG